MQIKTAHRDAATARGKGIGYFPMTVNSAIKTAIELQKQPNGDVYFYERQAFFDPLTGLLQKQNRQLIGVQKEAAAEVISVCTRYGQPKGSKLHLLLDEHNRIRDLIPVGLAPAAFSESDQAQVRAVRAQAQVQDTIAASQQLQPSLITADKVKAGRTVPAYGQVNDEPHLAPYRWSYYHQGQEIAFIPQEIPIPTANTVNDNFAASADDAKYRPQFYSVTASVSPSLLSTPVKAAMLPADKKIDRAWLPRSRTRAFVQEQEQAVAKAQAQAQQALAEAQALSHTSLYPDAICAHPAAKVNPIYAGLRATTVAYAANNAPAQLPAARSARHTALALPQGADALSVGQYGFTNLSSIYEPRVGASWQQICAPYQGFAPRALKAAPQIKWSPLARALLSTSTTGPALADRTTTGNSTSNARGSKRKVLPSFKDFSTPQDWDSTSFISASRFSPQAQKVPVTPRSATHISTELTLQDLWHSLNGKGKGNSRQLYFPPLPQPEAGIDISMGRGNGALLSAPQQGGAQRAVSASATGYSAVYGTATGALLPQSRDSAQGSEVDEAYSDNTVITSAVDGVYQQQTTHHTPELAHPELYDRNTITTYHHAPPAKEATTAAPAATVTTPEVAQAQGAASPESADSKDSADQGTPPPQPNKVPAVTAAMGKEAPDQQLTPAKASAKASDLASLASTTHNRPDRAAAQVSSSSQPAQNSGTTMTNQHSTGPTVAEAMAAAAAAPQQSAQNNTPAMPRANHLQGVPAPFNAPANVPMHSNGSRTQTQAQAQSQAPLPSQRRSTVGNKPAPVSAQTRAQAQAYIASLQAHANKAVMAVKAAQQIARAKFGDTYEIPPYDDPISTGTSMLEHLQLPNVNTRLYEDPNYIPSDSAIAFADQHAPYHQAFSHATSVSSYAYGAEFAEQATQGQRTPTLTAVTTPDYQKRSAAEYQQRAQALQDQGSANIIPMTTAPVAAPAPQQAMAMSAQTAIIDNRNRVTPLPPINAATAMAHSIGADSAHGVSTAHHNLGTGRINEEADRAEGSGYNTALGQSGARQFIPEHTPWWRDQAVTEQSAQEAFAADNFHQLQQGAFIGTPEEFLPEEKPQPAPTPTAPVYQRRSFITATNNDTTIISVPAAQEHLERNLTEDAYPLPEAALDAGSVMASEYDAAVQAEMQETSSQALSTSAHEALSATYHEPATLVSTPQGMISPADLVNSAAEESEEIAVSTITVGQSSLAPALQQALHEPEQEQGATRVKVKPQRHVGNTAIERRPLPPQPQIDRTFADFVTANGKKGTDDAVAAAAAAAARKGEFASRLDPTAPQHVADAVAVKSSTATAISSTSPDLAAALARQEPQEVEDVPAHPTAIAVTPSTATAPAASASTVNDESEGGYDFSDFKTADGSTVSGDYKIRVVSQKQLQAQRENEAALAKQAQEQAEKERKAAAQAQTEKLFDALQKAAMMESLAAHNAAECARELATLKAKQEQLSEQAQQEEQQLQEQQQLRAELEAQAQLVEQELQTAPEQAQESEPEAPDAVATAPQAAVEPQAPEAEPVATAAAAAIEPQAAATANDTAVAASESVSTTDEAVESTSALEQASATVAATTAAAEEAAEAAEAAASAATTAAAEAFAQPNANEAKASEVVAASAATVPEDGAEPYSSAAAEEETEAAAEAASAAAPSAESLMVTATTAAVIAPEASAPTTPTAATASAIASAQSAAPTEEDELADLEAALSQGKISKSQYKRLKRKFKPRATESEATTAVAPAAAVTAVAASVGNTSATTVATETETASESTAAKPSVDQDTVSTNEVVSPSDDSTEGTSAFLATDSTSEKAENSAALVAESSVSDTSVTDAVPLSPSADAASVSAEIDEENPAAASLDITTAAATEDAATASATAEEMTGSTADATNPASAPDGFLAAEAMLSATAMAADNSNSVAEVAESSSVADNAVSADIAVPEVETAAVAASDTPDTAENEAEITAVTATATETEIEETVSTAATTDANSNDSAEAAAPAATSPAQDSHSSTTLSSGEKSLRAVQQAADLRRDADLSMEASLNLVLAASAEQAQHEEEPSAPDETVSDSASESSPPSGERVVIIPEPPAAESAPEPEITALSANTIVTAQAVSSAQEQDEGEQSLADKLKLSPHTAVEQHEATVETLATDTTAESTAAEGENESAPTANADTTSESESTVAVTASAAESADDAEVEVETEVVPPATAETAPTTTKEDATESADEATATAEPEAEAEESVNAEAAAEAKAAAPDADTAHSAAPASTALEDAAPAAEHNTSAQEQEASQSATAAETAAAPTAAPELHLDLNASLQPATTPLPPQIPEQTVMVRAQYTHPSFEELSATIRGDSSNQPLNYNAIDVISPAYKAKDEATADIIARSGSGTEEPQPQPHVMEQHKAEVPQDVVFATPKRFISSGANNGLLNAEHGAQDDSGEGVKAMQEAVADVVATSLHADSDEELLAHSGITDEDATLAYLQATTSANPQHSAKTKNNNSLASLAAELIDDFDDPFEDSFSEGLSADEGQMPPSVRRSKGAKDSEQQ